MLLQRAREIAHELARHPGNADARGRAGSLHDELARLFRLPSHSDAATSSSRRWYHAKGTIDTRVIVLTLPAETVRQLLPAGLELAPQPVVPSSYHPVYIMSSHDVFEAWFGTMDYEEMLIGVPWVQISDPLAAYPGPFIYMPRLYLNDRLPEELGIHLYGWEKEMAKIVTADDGDGTTRYTVTAAGATSPTVDGVFKEIDGVGPKPAADVRNFVIVRQLFEQPTISQALRIVDPDAFNSKLHGPFLAANVRYLFDERGTTVQPITASVTIGDSLTPPGIPPGTYSSPSLRGSQLGAFRLRCDQRVTLPGSPAKAVFPRGPVARKLRVAVLGGGPAACTAALYLAQQTDRYEVKLYTTGHRLGGKCQSWRDPEKAWRIEEHGLHAFLGFYHNAFTAVRDAFHEAFESPEIGEAMYKHAFYAERYNGVMVQRNGEWTYCPVPSFSGASPSPEPPTTGAGHSLLTTLAGLARRVLDFIKAMRGEGVAIGREVFQRFYAHLVDVQGQDEGAGAGAGARSGKRLLSKVDAGLFKTVEDELAALESRLSSFTTYVWFLWTGLDTMITIARGLLRNPVDNLSELDDVDFRDWLHQNGLREGQDESWAVINQVYETLFAHQDRQGSEQEVCQQLETTVRPANLAAGVGVRWFLLESFGYRGAPAYRFEYSCAQTMMTPLYLALQRLGAEVNFFHTVTGLELAGEGEDRQLTRVHMQRQAKVKDGPACYQPLIDRDLPNNPKGLRDWPKDPHYDQLVDGEWFKQNGFDFYDSWKAETNPHAEPVSIAYEEDFDLCVLGVPLGALPMIESPLTKTGRADADPTWKAMIEGIAVTQTFSFQLWLKPSLEELIKPPMRGLLTTYAQPQPSWGDFSPLIRYELWTQVKPALIAYYTGASTAGAAIVPPACGADYPERMARQWEAAVEQWLRANYLAFFDGAATPPDFDGFLDALAVEGPALEGVARLLWQHLIADVEPSNLYVLSQQRSTALRLGQADSGVKSLILCGDWTTTDMNCGCVEAATSSGMLAARAISTEPRSIWRPGF